MVTRTYINKSNTIVKGTNDNFGLNPVCSLTYGATVSRVLMSFDIEKLKKQYDNREFTDLNNVKHTLKLYNCGAIHESFYDETIKTVNRKRASSFTVLFFKIPFDWDAGNGFDESTDIWLIGDTSVSINGSNWSNSMTALKWSRKGYDTEDGVYSIDTISKEYDKYLNGEESIIIAKAHYDHGNEDFEIDITDYINNVLEGKEQFHGIGICFDPILEEYGDVTYWHVGLFSNNTNTFFKPYLETRYTDKIRDERNSFYLGKTNKLYLYANINGELQNLDELPICKIDDVEYPVTHQSKGVYYASVNLDTATYKKDMILYDVWSNIKWQENAIDDVEMEFVCQSNMDFFSIGDSPLKDDYRVSVTLNGINDSEKMKRTDKRIITAIFNRAYDNTKIVLLDDAEYRLYVKDGKREVTVIDWDTISLMNNRNSFVIDTRELMPQDYHVDIKIKYRDEIIVFHDKLKFTIVNDTTKLKI